jgi:hypothetical protein
MNINKWSIIEHILDKYNIKPVVAVIPHNEDPKQIIDQPDERFWEKVRRWQEKGWDIAMHGYNHVYMVFDNGGLVPVNQKSEFAGLSLSEQEEKIKQGIEIFRRHGIEPKIWVAPSHTFDKNTLKALKKYSDISIISDGLALNPFMRYGFTWIPVQLWGFKKKCYGTWTICLHPNTMDLEKYLKQMSDFIGSQNECFISISGISTIHKRLTLFDRAYFCCFLVKKYVINKLLKFRSKFYLIIRATKHSKESQ